MHPSIPARLIDIFLTYADYEIISKKVEYYAYIF